MLKKMFKLNLKCFLSDSRWQMNSFPVTVWFSSAMTALNSEWLTMLDLPHGSERLFLTRRGEFLQMAIESLGGRGRGLTFSQIICLMPWVWISLYLRSHILSDSYHLLTIVFLDLLILLVGYNKETILKNICKNHHF